MTTGPRYFAYGSNMSTPRLVARVGPVRALGVARLANHRHAFDKFGDDRTGKGNICPASGDSVYGVLYAVSDAQLAALVDIEGGYRMDYFQVWLDRVHVRAASFIALAPHPHPLAPSPVYLAHYERGMREHGLPDDYATRVLDDGRALLRASGAGADNASRHFK